MTARRPWPMVSACTCLEDLCDEERCPYCSVVDPYLPCPREPGPEDEDEDEDEDK